MKGITPRATAPSVNVVLLPGHHVASLEGVDAHGRIAMDEAFIDVLDTLPPVLEIGGSIKLWPPKHRLIRVSLPVQVSAHATPSDASSGSGARLSRSIRMTIA